MLCLVSLGCILPKLLKGPLRVNVSSKEADRVLLHMVPKCATSLPVIPAAQVTGKLVGRHGRRLFIIDYQALPCGCALKFGLENAKDLLALTVETDVVRKSGPLVKLYRS